MLFFQGALHVHHNIIANELNSSNRSINFTSEYNGIALNFIYVSIKVGVGNP